MSALDSNPSTDAPVASVHLMRAGCLIVAGIVSSAFGAHAAKEVLEPEGLDAFQTAARYLLFMGVAVLAACASGRERGLGWVEFGVVLFSGSIFSLLYLQHMGWPSALLGPLTPVGGALMIGGWVWWVRALRWG